MQEKRKNIVLFSDGTGQEGGVGNNSNVYDLFNMIEDRTQNQISFYDQGLGTGWSKVGAISGLGVSRNVQQAYQFLSEYFSARDHIYLFGFSRGATTVRTLSAFVDLFGILPRSRPELFKKAWRIYKMANRETRRQKADAFVQKNHSMWTPIRFLGVWDTVAALGLPFKGVNWLIDRLPFMRHSYHDLSLAESVEYARHALAVDDERQTFRPVLWEERGSRSANSGPMLFSMEDIRDVYNVAEMLQNVKGNVVSKHLSPKLEPSTVRLLERLERPKGRRDSLKKGDMIRAALVKEFNKVLQSSESIYDAKQETKANQLEMSETTRDAIARFDKLARRRSRVAKKQGTAGPLSSPHDVSRLNRLLLEDAYKLKPRIKQVWFAGMHSDVGGGYQEKGLSHIALLWMVTEAIDVGLRIYPKHEVDLDPDPCGVMHNSRSGLARLYRKRVREWKPQENQGRLPLVHESVVGRYAEIRPYNPWILKAKHDVEPWPERLEASIQTDHEHVWREEFWGWGAQFKVAWEDIDRISCDQSNRSITLHTKEGGPDTHIRGSLPRDLPALVEQLDRERERKRLSRREKMLAKQDDLLAKQDQELNSVLKRLDEQMTEVRNHINLDMEQTSKLEQAAAERDRKLIELVDLRKRLGELEGQIEEPPQETPGDREY